MDTGTVPVCEGRPKEFGDMERGRGEDREGEGQENQEKRYLSPLLLLFFSLQ